LKVPEIFLSVVSMLPLAILGVISIQALFKDNFKPQARLVETGMRPEIALDHQDGQHYHLYLSHYWNGGEQYASMIKKELQHMCPGLMIFLGSSAASRTQVCSEPPFTCRRVTALKQTLTTSKTSLRHRRTSRRVQQSC
jgi:hypothetical protein